MPIWYVEEVFTPSDSNGDRTRKYAEFAAEAKTPVPKLAAQAMVRCGWFHHAAQQNLRDEANLDGTTIQNGSFDFNIFSGLGEYTYKVSRMPIHKAANAAIVYVVMADGKPVAVRSRAVSELTLAEIAAKLDVPVASLSVVKVEDVVD